MEHRARMFSLLLALILLTGIAPHPLDGTYADKSDDYSVKVVGVETVHLEIISGGTDWKPLDAAFDNTTNTISANFSNCATVLTGQASSTFARITWNNGVVWQRSVPASSVTSVHLVFMTHLDLGFTDTTRNVCDKYFDSYFPLAFKTAADLRARGGPERFRWTEFSWLIQEYLDGGAGCAHRDRTPEEVSMMEAAIANDDVIWHATAVNFLPEVLDEHTWAYSMGMASALNQRFNKSWGTIAGKHTDTPGMSKGAIPALLRHGVRAYHIGYNSACAKNVAELPPAFRWRAPGKVGSTADNSSDMLLTFVNDNYGSEIRVQEEAEGDLEQRSPFGKSLHIRHGIAGAEDVALIFQFTGDNGGLPDANAVVKYWASLQAKFPNAKITASSLDDFSREVMEKGDMSTVPVIDGEIGDSWIYGAPADPIKVATFREAVRMLQGAVTAGDIDPADGGYIRYMRRLMKGPAEHNWGLSIDHGAWASDWDNSAFAKRRATDSDWAAHEEEWKAQREWMHPCTVSTAPSLPLTCNASNAAAAGGGAGWADFVAALETRLQKLMMPSSALLPVATLGKPMTPSSLNAAEPISCGDVDIAFSGSDGSIRYLREGSSRLWVGGGAGTLAKFTYRSYSDADFSEIFASEYTTSGDFMKQGMASAKPVDREWDAALDQGFIQRSGSQCVAAMQLSMADATAHTLYGAPQHVTLQYTVPGTNGALVDIALIWQNKTATRLAESTWLSFVPISTESTPSTWSMDIMGHAVSPLEVVPGGTHWVHAVSRGATFNTSSATLRIEPLDTPLLSPGDTAHLLRYNDEQPDAVLGGMHINLHNNLWGTAFPQWYSDDGLARFQVFSDA